MNEKKATIKDIARLAEVSETTVSLSFQENSRISEKTRSRIMEIAEDLNYFPNFAARALRYGVTKTIGFVVLDIGMPFYSQISRTVEKLASRRGFQVIFAESNWEPEKEIEVVSGMLRNRVQGILMCFCERTERSYDLIRRSGMPLIAVDTYPSFYKGAFVASDAYMAGYLAGKHLADTGCTSLAFITGGPLRENFSSFSQQRAGFETLLKERGMSLGTKWIVNTDLSIVGGKRACDELLRRSVDTDGIFCVNDTLALGALEAALQNGLVVGDDLKVIGIDDLEVSSLSSISLTTMKEQNDAVVSLAVHSLIDSIESGIPPVIQEHFEPELRIRRSTTG